MYPFTPNTSPDEEEDESYLPVSHALTAAGRMTDMLVALVQAVCHMHQGRRGISRVTRRRPIRHIVSWLDVHYSCIPTSAEMMLLQTCRFVLSMENHPPEQEHNDATGVTAFLKRCGMPQ
jgi:hypothetical protein